MFDADSYDWEADTMAATLPRPADKPVSRTMHFPLPPSLPEGVEFHCFRIDGYLRSGCSAPDLDRAVSEYLSRGTDSRLSARASRYVPCTPECLSFHGDKHDDEAKCGDWCFESVYDQHSQTWGEWKPEC
jgi:hypothetical protein